MRGSRGHHEAATCEVAHESVEDVERGIDDDGHVGELALPDVSAGEKARLGHDEADSARAERRHVCLGGGVRPHVDVHGGSHEDGGMRGEERGREAVVGDARGHLRHDVRRRGHDEDEVGPVGEEDVRDGALGEAIEVIRHGMLGKRFEGGGADEPLGIGAHDDAHVAASLLQAAKHLAGLVGGDAPGDGEKDLAGVAHAHPSTSSVTIILWQ